MHNPPVRAERVQPINIGNSGLSSQVLHSTRNLKTRAIALPRQPRLADVACSVPVLSGWRAAFPLEQPRLGRMATVHTHLDRLCSLYVTVTIISKWSRFDSLLPSRATTHSPRRTRRALAKQAWLW